MCSGFTISQNSLMDGSALSSAQYIQKNLDKINNYAKSEGYETNINDCTMQKIQIFDGEVYEDGYFVDFNDNNGFLTIGNDFSIYDFSFVGDITGNNILVDFTYSVHDGYNYKGKNYETHNLEEERFYTPADFDGTNDNGEITDLPMYVVDRYGSEYTLYEGKRVTTMSGVIQYAQSVYIHHVDGLDYSEGNCGLISANNYLKYLRVNRSYINIPYYTYEYYYASIDEPNLYNERSADSTYTTKNPKYMSTALADIRRDAYRINGGPEGLTVWQSKNLLNYAMEEYGYSTRFNVIEAWSYSTVTSRIDNNKALLWSVLWQEVYNNHTMFVSGYQTYRKEGKFLWWTTYDYLEFFVIKDGHSSSDRYYDFNGSNGNTWSGAFVVEQ